MRVYYNEFDKAAAQWLRNLIQAGLIPQGDVDERSIEDVRPSDLAGYRQCHFFAGIGGWAHALELAKWGDSPVWTGSCPCQPFSAAGKGDGFADERHLWPAWFHLISQCRPERIFGEQVAGAANHGWLDLVQSDLEGQGYRVGAAVLGAHSVGAPHIRQRLWFVADTNGGQSRKTGAGRIQPGWEHGLLAEGGGPSFELADTDGNGRAQVRSGIPSTGSDGLVGNSSVGCVSNSMCSGQQGQGGVVRSSDSATGGDRQEHRIVYAGRSHWSSAIEVPCADGKARIIEPGLEPLAHGVQDFLVRLCAIEDAGLKEVIAYGKQNKRDTNQVLRELRERFSERESRKEESTGMLQQLHEEEVLLDFLLCLNAAQDKPANRSGFEKTSAEVRRRIVLGMWNSERAGCSPHQRKPDGQQQREPSDALLSLSLVLARHAQTHREAARSANASSNRVVRLRGYGNAIVPQAAAAFIKAYMSSVNEN